MNEEIIKQVAQQIVNESILENMTFYLLIFAITMVSTAVSTFAISYFKKRGESYATKQDFQQVLSQLEQSTEATEKIRSEVISKFSQDEERRRIKREKLEQVIENTYDLELWLEQVRTKALAGETFDINSSPLSKLEMIVTIYFPESLQTFKSLRTSSGDTTKWILTLHAEHLRAKSANCKAEFNIEEYKKLHPAFLQSLNAFRDEIILKHKTDAGL